MSAALVAIGLIASGHAVAQEPSRETLRQLRQQQKYGEAERLIDAWEKQADLPEELRQVLDFERGETLLAQAIRPETVMGRTSMLKNARANFQRFMEKQPKHDLVPDAKDRVATVLVELARDDVQSSKTPANANRREELLASARDKYDQAIKLVDEVFQTFRKLLLGLPKVLDPARDAAKFAYRDELRAKYVRLQLVRATILHERANTFTDAAQRDEALVKAANAYDDLYQKYRTRMAGLFARLQQGRCQEDREKWEDALEIYGELLEALPEEHDAFRSLRTKTLARAAECWANSVVGKHEIAIKSAEEWLKDQRPNEDRDDDWLELKLNVAKAYRQRVLSKDSWTDEVRREARTKAIEYATQASKHSPRLGDNAKKLLDELHPR
jgi:tetratricopeptide (TPR) repeat protein